MFKSTNSFGKHFYTLRFANVNNSLRFLSLLSLICFEAFSEDFFYRRFKSGNSLGIVNIAIVVLESYIRCSGFICLLRIVVVLKKVTQVSARPNCKFIKNLSLQSLCSLHSPIALCHYM